MEEYFPCLKSLIERFTLIPLDMPPVSQAVGRGPAGVGFSTLRKVKPARRSMEINAWEIIVK
jgi:hypothetical protein